MESWASALPI